jgi:hypothetical protein
VRAPFVTRSVTKYVGEVIQNMTVERHARPRDFRRALAIGCTLLALLCLIAATPQLATAGLTLEKNARTGLHGTYSNANATIRFQTIRTGRRVSATVSGADGNVLMTVEGNRRDMPQVTFAGIPVTDHGDFSDEETAAIRALRVSPQALALGEMLRGLPPYRGGTRNPWAALHELYHFLTYIGGEWPDGLYEWEEAPPAEPTARVREESTIGTATSGLRCLDCDPGGDPPDPPGPLPTPQPQPGSAWNCAGDADQCIGMAGPSCWGTYVFGTRVKKWLCEALRHDINRPQRDCSVNGSSTTGGCCGTLEDAVTALLTKPDLGRDGLITCGLNNQCPSPAACCSQGGVRPNGCHMPGGVCREMEFCDPNGNLGSNRIWPCPNEASAGAKFLITTWNPDYQNGNLLKSDAVQFTFSEPGRIVMGISCKFSGLGVINVDTSSSICQYYGKCTVADLLTIDKNLLDDMVWRFPADLPFYHVCTSHAFGWYEIPNLRAGTWLAFSKSISTWGLDGHATADTYAYVGNGGRVQATWSNNNACQLTVDINNPRFFVRQQYKDFYAREPDGASNFGGARDFGAGPWQVRIDAIEGGTQSRADVAWGFMQSPEFTAAHPVLDPINIGTQPFVDEFIRQCYLVFLRREPDLGGFQFWRNVLTRNGSYVEVVNAFILSTEYLHRSACSFGPSYCN